VYIGGGGAMATCPASSKPSIDKPNLERESFKDYKVL